MPAGEGALVARARGVRTHLATRQMLEHVADAPDVPSLARGLARAGFHLEPAGEAPDIGMFEQAARRTAGRHLATLLRWQSRHPGVVDVFVAWEDRRSLRALIRGAVHGAPVEARLAGLLPTPRLPERALTELSRQASPSAVVAQLILLQHPEAVALRPLVQKAHPDLLAVEVALLRGCASGALAAVHASDRTAREVVARRIDVGNVENALLMSAGAGQVDVGDAFVAGGRWLPADAFAVAAMARSRQAALSSLAEALARTPLASMLPVVATDLSHIARAALAQTLSWLRHTERLEPLGTAPLFGTLLAIEAQTHDLRALAWGALLGTPAAVRKQALVTPWH